MESQRVEAGTVRLSIQRWTCRAATRPMVVLLPGMGETAADWHDVAAELSQDRDVIAVDLRGHGNSDWPGVYSVELMAHDVRCLLAGLETPVDLIGHSLGGLVAWLVAAGEPAAVRRLVLEEVALLRPREPAPPSRPAGQLDFDWAVVEQVRQEIDAPDPRWPARATAVTAATLVIGGGSKSFVPQQHVADLADAIPHAQLITIDAGHDVHAVERDQFLSAVRSFLDASGSGILTA